MWSLVFWMSSSMSSQKCPEFSKHKIYYGTVLKTTLYWEFPIFWHFVSESSNLYISKGRETFPYQTPCKIIWNGWILFMEWKLLGWMKFCMFCEIFVLNIHRMRKFSWKNVSDFKEEFSKNCELVNLWYNNQFSTHGGS